MIVKLTEQQKEIALRVVREYDPSVTELMIPGILEFAARFLAALPKPEPVAEIVKYGCHVDGDHDVIPNCVHDIGDLDDCTYAQFHEKKQDCPYWKPIKFATPPQPDDVRDAWQPIETAPKDGTEILCVTKVGIMVLFWDTGFWREKASFLGLRTDPTHWMPLPEAPAIAAAKGEV